MSSDVKENFSTAEDAVPVDGAATVTADPLRSRIRTLLPSMTRSMQRVAEAVVADPAGCAVLTVTEMAVRTGTSEATVVRTARLLGYPGYRDLRIALAGTAVRERVAEPPGVVADITLDDPMSEVVAKLAREEQQTLADTAAQLDPATLSAAVDSLVAARRIDVYGIGASGLVAQDLVQKLLRIGMVAHAHCEMHSAVTSAVVLRPGDVAVAITDSGGTVDVIEPLRAAFERGATTIAVTGRPKAPVVRYADHVLTTTAGRETELRPGALGSRTSQLLVVDCLFIGVAQRTYDSTRNALAASRAALAHRHTRS
ncbi:MurR/RpiR family transcriptional regulator [Allostreptomyces psammosilenae]|uniref:DNA-binding MurR/RpiR family transcriptional regulator n=1 Tax=Allostreptomyces psammosilenae TaxID=1892865 RepID=A0A853A0I7_9ACTN|nr:MurR/RpiR family transcriptional regulator [Allostreptomyces psammosilenae]NYI07637.1 DNA-binding MurR/RpiR family transcriptional regulator [Allostreptomyces psammosilenae]